MKVLLVSTVISSIVSALGSGVSTTQEHIWFNGPSAFSDCTQIETALHSGQVTVVDGKKTSVDDSIKYVSTKRETKCMRMSE